VCLVVKEEAETENKSNRFLRIFNVAVSLFDCLLATELITKNIQQIRQKS
jgi:hypothetical protein